jgi:hypothetical protein
MAVGDEYGVRAAVLQRLRRPLALLARADHQHAAVRQVAGRQGVRWRIAGRAARRRVQAIGGCPARRAAGVGDGGAGGDSEAAAGQLGRDGGHRHARAADAGVGPDVLAGREGVAEEAVGDRAGHALDQRELVGALDLALDLGLADDHRVEARGDREEMAGDVEVAQRVERVGQLGRARLGLAREDCQRGALGGDGVGRDEVELGAVAGRDRDRLVDLLVGGQLGEHRGRAPLGQREPLAQFQRRRLVRDAERQQLAAHATGSPSRGSTAAAAPTGSSSSLSAISTSSVSSRSIRAIFAAMIDT